MPEWLSAGAAEQEAVVFPEELGKQAANAVRHLANSFVVVAETGHKSVIEQRVDDRLKAALKPLHHKHRTATRRLHTWGFRDMQSRAEHIRSLLHGIARCLETPSEPVPITVLSRSAIEAAALIVHAQDPSLSDLDRCTRYAALLLGGHHSLNVALREVIYPPTDTRRMTQLRDLIDRAGMTINYDARRKSKPISVSNSLDAARKESCNPEATALTKKVLGTEVFYRLFSGATHGSAGHLLPIQDWTDEDQGPIRIRQVLVTLLGLADAVPAAYCAILDAVELDCAQVNKSADLLVGLVQRMSDKLPEESRIVIPTDRRITRAAK